MAVRRSLATWPTRDNAIGGGGARSDRPRNSARSASAASPACRHRRRSSRSKRSRIALEADWQPPWQPRACRGNRDRLRRVTVPPRSSTPIAVATAVKVTPAQATSASSSMSPEQAASPSPPVAGCRPASTRARPVSTLHRSASSPSRALGLERHEGRSGVVAVARLERRLHRLKLVPVHRIPLCRPLFQPELVEVRFAPGSRTMIWPKWTPQ